MEERPKEEQVLFIQWALGLTHPFGEAWCWSEGSQQTDGIIIITIKGRKQDTKVVKGCLLCLPT